MPSTIKPIAVAALALALGATASLTPAFAEKKRVGPGQEEPKSEGKLGSYESPFPLKMTWVLSTINGKPAPADATLLIDENLRGSGTGGCNTWSATLYPIRGKRLAMGPVAMTQKACPPPVMAFENAYLGILHSGPTWSQAASTLTVQSKAGTLVFNRGL